MAMNNPTVSSNGATNGPAGMPFDKTVHDGSEIGNRKVNWVSKLRTLFSSRSPPAVKSICNSSSYGNEVRLGTRRISYLLSWQKRGDHLEYKVTKICAFYIQIEYFCHLFSCSLANKFGLIYQGKVV